MEYAKITVKPTTPFISVLQSDTIFGHFAWGVRFLYGKEKLEELLESFEKKPFIIFSDGFKKGYLPKPLLKPFTGFSCDKADYIKKLKKLSFVPKELIFKNIDSLKDEIFLKYIIEKKESCKKKRSKTVTQKNSINRLTNRVDEGLYSIKERFFKDDEFEIYFAYQNISQDDIKEVFSFISKRGFGKDKSTGKGRFEFKIDWEFEEKRYFTTKSTKYFNLSTMLLNKENMHLYYGKTTTKFAKAGGFYASSEPFKNPFICYIPGSTFLVSDGVLGRAERKIYNKSNHYQNGFSIGIYFDGE